MSHLILFTPVKAAQAPVSPPAGAAIVLHSPLISQTPATVLHHPLPPDVQSALLVHLELCDWHLPCSCPYALSQNPLWHLKGEKQIIVLADWHIPIVPHLSPVVGHLLVPSVVHPTQCPLKQTPVAHCWLSVHSAPLIFICLCVGAHVLPTHSFPAPHSAFVEHLVSPPAGAAIVLHSPLISQTPATVLHHPLPPDVQSALLVHLELCDWHLPCSCPYALSQNPLWHLKGEKQIIVLADWHIPIVPHLSPVVGHLLVPSVVHPTQCPLKQTPVAHCWLSVHSAPLIFICLCVGAHVLPTHSFPAPHSVFVEHLIAAAGNKQSLGEVHLAPAGHAWHVCPAGHCELVVHAVPSIVDPLPPVVLSTGVTSLLSGTNALNSRIAGAAVNVLLVAVISAHLLFADTGLLNMLVTLIVSIPPVPLSPVATSHGPTHPIVLDGATE